MTVLVGMYVYSHTAVANINGNTSTYSYLVQLWFKLGSKLISSLDYVVVVIVYLLQKLR